MSTVRTRAILGAGQARPATEEMPLPIGHNMPPEATIVPESISPDQLLWPEEIAAELGIKPETLAAWRSLGKGPPYLKTGRFVRYTRPDYVGWLKTRRQQPVTAQARRSETVA